MMKTVSIIIPAFNEEHRLPRTLQRIAEYNPGEKSFAVGEVIVVDDGSSDQTSAVAQTWSDRLPITVLRLEKNTGKGAALRAGVLKATGVFVLIYDADGAVPIEELNILYKELNMYDAAIAIGSRVGEGARERVQISLHRRIIGRIYHAITAPLIPGIRDAACGCKLFRADAAHDLFSRQRIKRFAYDIEVLSLALQQGMRICEVPVRCTAVPVSKVRIVRDGCEMFLQVLLLYRRFFSRPMSGNVIHPAYRCCMKDS